MGCYPLGKMVAKVFDKCKGRKRRGIATTMVYSPPPSYSYARSVAKHVTFSTDHAVVMPPDTVQMVPPVSKHHHPGPAISPSPQAEMAQSNEQCRVRFTPESTTQHGEIPNPPRAPRSKQPRFPVEQDHQAADGFAHPLRREPPQFRDDTANRNEPPPTYTASPLPRWEEGERRREYFGGEYHYYPTPVREGIYRIATDPNRLTTIFSEENPNACSIV
ncbi:uncharacterized protein LOC122006558 [Zingiber officinale]|nr:uncharacterized protein LOC122006558 [Zingiber officinale]